MIGTPGTPAGVQPGPYAFSGIPTFLRAPLETDLARARADIAVLGIPSDEGSPYQAGSRFGPRGIREHSLRFGTSGYYDGREDRVFLEEEMREKLIVDMGDVNIVPTDVQGNWDRITEAMKAVLAHGALPVVIGGDHAITAPVVRAWAEPVHVVHFDAHIDYAPFQHGFSHTNTHAFRHIRAMPHVASLTQIGIRSLRNPQSDVYDSLSDGNTVIGMEELRDTTPRGLVERLPADAPVYVSIDIDVLDMALVPGCVSGEPDGLLYPELREALIALSEHTNVVGLDLVEVNPLLDVATGATSYLAAHTIVEFLGHVCAQPRWTERRDERAEARRRALFTTPDAATEL